MLSGQTMLHRVRQLVIIALKHSHDGTVGALKA